MTKDEFIIECKKINIEIQNEIITKLEKYKELLIQWNKKFNLTTIIEDKSIYLKHFYDSLCLSKIGNLNNKTICDFGTGAGFPGIVIAIVYNKSKVTLIESNSKKVKFLEKVKEDLNLENVNIINARVEEYSKKNNIEFDIVTCRAVSNINIILELSCKLVKLKGIFTPLKTNIIDENILESNYKKLGYELIDIINYKLPIENSTRCIPIYKKIKKTDNKYPRNYSTIIKEYKK